MQGDPTQAIDTWRFDDGTAVTIRPIRPSDAALELAFLEGLSGRTRYQRLLSARQLLPGELRRLVHVDFSRDMALIATVRVLGVEVQIGVARYVREDERSAEFAIVVADEWQGRRLGERLLRGLLEAAPGHGIEHLSGIALTTNAAMLALARRLGFRLTLEKGDATVTRIEWTFPLAARPARQTRPDAAQHAG